MADQHHQDATATQETLARIEALLTEQVRLTTAASQTNGTGTGTRRRTRRTKEDA